MTAQTARAKTVDTKTVDTKSPQPPILLREAVGSPLGSIAVLTLNRPAARNTRSRRTSRLGDETSAGRAREVAVAAYSMLGLHDHARRLSQSPASARSSAPSTLVANASSIYDVVALNGAGNVIGISKKPSKDTRT